MPRWLSLLVKILGAYLDLPRVVDFLVDALLGLDVEGREGRLLEKQVGQYILDPVPGEGFANHFNSGFPIIRCIELEDWEAAPPVALTALKVVRSPCARHH